MYSTDDLVQRAVQALRKMQKVEAAKVSFTTAELSVTNAGVEAHAVAAKTETVQYRGLLPDILAYLQNGDLPISVPGSCRSLIPSDVYQ
jgi:type III restriction enzyme